MKIGTVLKNEYVTDDNPLKYTICIGNSGNYVSVAYAYQGKIHKSQYHHSDIGNRNGIHSVGYTDVLKRIAQLIEDELLNFSEESEE